MALVLDYRPNDVAGSPDWWLRRLMPKLDAQALKATQNERYFRNEQGIPVHANKRMKDAARRLLDMATTNFAELIVEAVRERMVPIGFRTGAVTDPTGDAEAWRIWQMNALDADCDLVHRAQLSMGVAYVIVGAEDGEVIITPEDPRQVVAEVDPVRRRVVRAALKVFRDDLEDVDRAYLYLPGVVHRATRAVNAATRDVVLTADGWEWDGGVSLSTKRVPVVPFVNRPNIFNEPQAEFETHTSILDRINYSLLNRLEVATMQAFRQRAVKGVPLFDQHGNQIDYSDVFAPDPGAMWHLPEAAELWESGQVDLGPIRQSIRDDVEHLAAVARMPVHYLEPVNESAEGVEAKREGLIFTVADRCKQAGESWELVMSIAFELLGDDARASRGDMEVIWQPAERYSLTEKASAASQLASVLTWRALMQDVMQYSPQQITRLNAERAAESLRANMMGALARPRLETPQAPVQGAQASDQTNVTMTMSTPGQPLA